MEKKNVLDKNFALYAHLLDKFLPSADMREYLLEGHPSEDDIVDIIFYSPAGCLDEKSLALLEVCEHTEDKELKEKCKSCCLFLHEALELLKKNGIFTLEYGFFDKEIKQQVVKLEGVFSNFTEAKEKMSLWEDDDEHWFQLILWDKNENRKMYKVAHYIIVNGKPVYCRIDDNILKNTYGLNPDYLWLLDMFFMSELNLPVPFKAGDIVVVGSAPFVPRHKIVITEVGDNLDCCCLQGFGKSSDGEYATGAVKHGHVGYARTGCHIVPSLLYEMTKYEGLPNYEEQTLNEVARVIKDIK